MSINVIKVKASSLSKELPESAPEELVCELRDHSESYAFIGKENGIVNTVSFYRPREWDSRFFGLKMATLYSYILDNSIVNQKSVEKCIGRTVEETREEKVACVFSRVGLETPAIIRAQEKVGFHIYDIGCKFRYQSSKAQNSRFNNLESLTEPSESDIWELIALSSQLFELDHYHQDSRIGKEAADSMYGIWIRNLYFDESCRVSVSKNFGRIDGFVSIREISQNRGTKSRSYVIDLIGVSKENRGRGFGKGLLAWALKQIPPTSQVYVSTQLSNRAAVQLYLNAGFMPLSYYATMHLWH